jgi:hypothetical protein
MPPGRCSHRCHTATGRGYPRDVLRTRLSQQRTSRLLPVLTGAVNDQATATLMVALHRHLRGGAGLAEALRLAPDGTKREPVLAATARSFLALGAA